jgi:hypothetical protein
MFIGEVVFALIAVFCIVVGAISIKRRRAVMNSPDAADDVDFDEYEGFDK